MGWFGARRERYEERLDDEMRFHLERQIADYVAEGMSLESARRRALIEFGGPAQIKEECREVRRVNSAGDLIQDILYAVRMIRKRPGFGAVAVMTLALGIGAMMMIFGVLALLLAAVGVYGVMAHSVTQRRREFGIRIALGARPVAVLKMVVRQGFVLAAWGIAAGLAGGFAVSRLMARIMYGVSSNSITVLAGVPALPALVSLAACWIPARAATLADPVTVLRQD